METEWTQYSEKFQGAQPGDCGNSPSGTEKSMKWLSKEEALVQVDCDEARWLLRAGCQTSFWTYRSQRMGYTPKGDIHPP